MLILVDLVLLAVAALATALLLRSGRQARRRAEARAHATLATAGLRATGDVVGAFEARPLEGVDVLLKNRTSHTRPGDAEPTSDLCVAQVAVLLADQIVCKASEVDTVMGPLPTVPRVRTEYAPFDDAYAVFVGVAGAAPGGGSYRAAPVAGDIPWAQQPLLDGFVDLDLRWMRVHDGTADLVFPALAVEDVGRATALACAVEHAAGGRPLPILGRGPRVIRPAWSDTGKSPGAAWGAGILPGLVGGMLLTFAPPLQDLDAELACGAGGRIITISSSHGHGTSYGVACQGFPADHALGLHYLGCGLLGGVLVVLAGLGIVFKRSLRG